MRNPRLGCSVLCLAAMLAAAMAAGCGGGPARSGPTPIPASPPAAYPLEREQPGGTVEAVPPEQAPVAKPLREELPTAVVRQLPSETATAAGPSEKIPLPPERTGEVPAVPHLDPSAGATIPLPNAILAEINGDIITREEILGPLRPQIELWKKNLSEADFQERCRYYVELDLRKEISRRLALQEARTTLSEDEKKEIDAQVKQTEQNLISEAGSKPRLEARLAAEGSTLERETTHERERLMIQRLLRQKVVLDVQVTHSELLDLYERVKDERFVVLEQAHLLLITLKKSDSANPEAARALAEAVYDRARRGEDFGKLAGQYSRDPKAKSGGDWGMIGRGSLKAAAVDAALFALRRNELGPLVETPDTYYIVKCLEHQEGRTRPFIEVQADLERELREQKREQTVQKYIQDLSDRAFIRVMTENL